MTGVVIPTNLDSPPGAGGLTVALPPELAQRVQLEAAKRGEAPRHLVVNIVDLVFGVGSQSLVGAVLDDDPSSST